MVEGRTRQVCPDCEMVHYDNPHPAVTLIVPRADELLLVKRAVPPALGEWCLPGGFMEVGESAAQAGQRELAEETALKAQGLTFLKFCSKPGSIQGDLLVFAFVVRTYTGSLTPGDDALDAKFFPLSDLPPVAFGCHREFIRSYQNLPALAAPEGQTQS